MLTLKPTNTATSTFSITPELLRIPFGIKGELPAFPSPVEGLRIAIPPPPAGKHYTAAWLASFTGGNFAEIIWTLQDLNNTGITIYAKNMDNKSRSPDCDSQLIIALGDVPNSVKNR